MGSVDWQRQSEFHPDGEQMLEESPPQPHAEGMNVDWQERYEQGDTPWDKGAPHPWLPAHGLAGLADDMRVLVPGCGRGHDLHFLARRHPQVEWVGIDISPLALEGAAAGLPENAKNVRLFQSGFEEHAERFAGCYDGIWEHTLFCAIDPALRRSYWQAMAALLVDGGWLQGVFFTTMEDGGSGPPWNCPEQELLKLTSDCFTVDQRQPVEKTFPERRGEETFFRFHLK